MSPLNVCRFMYELSSQGLAYFPLTIMFRELILLNKLNDGDDLREDFGAGLMLILGCVSKYVRIHCCLKIW